MVETTAPKLITVGVIADTLNESVERVRRVLATRRHIQPAAYAGHVRLFSSDAIAHVRYELNAIDARRGKKGVARA